MKVYATALPALLAALLATAPGDNDGRETSEQTQVQLNSAETHAVPATEAGETPVDPLEAAFNRFQRLRDEGRREEATTAAMQVAELAREHYGPQSLELATPLINLAVMQAHAGELSAAEQNYLTAIAIIERHEGALSARLINPLSGLGHAYNRAGMYEQAIKHFERALRLNHIESGFTNFKQFGIQDGLTESYVGLRDYEEANFYQESQLEIYQRKFGQQDPQVVPAMYKLAEWYSRIGNLEESALAYRSADRIIRENDGETSVARTDALMGLARLYERQANQPAAASTLRKAIKILEAGPEPDLMRRAELRVALGDLYVRESRFGSAKDEYAAAWADLSSSDEYLERRDYFFELPVRLGGGPFPKLSRNAYGRAESELRDGYVEIRYTVDEDGRAQDVMVIESDPPEVMDASLLTTYRRSVYRPRFAEGDSVRTENLLARHEFRYAVDADAESPEQGKLPRPDTKRGRIDYPGGTETE